jgi:hypothetical protein
MVFNCPKCNTKIDERKIMAPKLILTEEEELIFITTDNPTRKGKTVYCINCGTRTNFK